MLELSNLKKELIGFEGNVQKLNNKMESLDFYGEYENWEDIIESRCVSYQFKSEDIHDFENVILDFEVVIENGEDEIAEASELKITDVR